MSARRLTLVAMSLGFGVVQLDVSVVNVAIHAIGLDLGGAVSDLQWVVNAYTVAFAAFILTAGALGDRIGARRCWFPPRSPCSTTPTPSPPNGRARSACGWPERASPSRPARSSAVC